MNTTKSNKNIVPTKNKIIKLRTIKTRIPSRNNAIKKMYNRDYYGKDLLPITNIIQYIDANFNDYMSMKEQKTSLDLPSSSFEDFFIVDDILKRKENVANIDIQINKQPNVSLNKLLAYSLYYSEYKSWFNSDKMDTSLFKFQIGKDASRINLTINKENFNFNDKDKNNIKADKLNIELMTILSKFNIIDLDLINKIGIVVCQNIINYITDLISLMISNKIAPEKMLITQATKNIVLTLTKTQQNSVINFKTKFWITKDGSIDHPELTCGDMEFSFLIDFKKNTYKFINFKCKYDANICYQEEIQENVANVENVTNVANVDNSKYLTYGIPLALGVGGIIAAPFLLGALGGKNKKIKNKKSKRVNKTKKRKKSFYK